MFLLKKYVAVPFSVAFVECFIGFCYHVCACLLCCVQRRSPTNINGACRSSGVYIDSVSKGKKLRLAMQLPWSFHKVSLNVSGTAVIVWANA